MLEIFAPVGNAAKKSNQKKVIGNGIICILKKVDIIIQNVG